MAADKGTTGAAATVEHQESNGGAVAVRGAAPAGTLAKQRTMDMALQGLVPTSMGEAVQLAQHLANADVIPKSLRRKPDSVLAVMLAGLEIGITPLKAVNNITIISGNMAMKADLQLAVVRHSGLLSFFDEGFETSGESDTTLIERADTADPGAVQAAKQILLLVKGQGVPKGKPYGWVVVQRAGESKRHVRVFSWVDAERAFVYDSDDDAAPGERKKQKKLSEKFNYVAWPQSMYPRRARSAILGVLFSDALAGIPAVEQLEGGQVEGADPTVIQADADDADMLMAAIRDTNPELATSIDAGFEQLRFGKAKRLQKLNEYKGKPDKLLLWLKDEYARMQGKRGAARPNVLGADQAQPAEAQPAAGGVIDADVVEEEAGGAADPEPEPEPAEPAKSGLASVTERFKTALPKGSGSF